MQALTVVPLERDSAELTEIDEPRLTDHDTLLVEMVCVGVCGTDREIPRAITAKRRRDRGVWCWGTSR